MHALVRNLLSRSQVQMVASTTCDIKKIRDFATYLGHAHASPVFVRALTAPEFTSRSAREDLRRTLELFRAPLLVTAAQASGPSRTLEALEVLAESGLRPAFTGHAEAGVRVFVFDAAGAPPSGVVAPPDFRAIAIVPTFNEEDIVALTIADLVAQGLEVYLLDNWSTDGTVERAQPFLGKGLMGLERFPARPSSTYDLSAILQRVEQIALDAEGANWIMLHDADERRRSPWQGISLRDAFWHADQCGFSCIDHVTLNFWPTSDGFYESGCDLEEYFQYFEFSSHPGHFHQRRAWKRQPGQRVTLVPTAGHDPTFPGRRVYPYKFLLKHYPVRSQAHGERKVLHERRARFAATERARGWHRQYDELSTSFLRDASTLEHFDPTHFDDEWLIERLSGAGVFAEPPSWATAPRW